MPENSEIRAGRREGCHGDDISAIEAGSRFGGLAELVLCQREHIAGEGADISRGVPGLRRVHLNGPGKITAAIMREAIDRAGKACAAGLRAILKTEASVGFSDGMICDSQ